MTTNNYILIMKTDSSNKITQADVVRLTDAKFDAITIIAYDGQDFPPPPTPPPARTIKVTYKGTLNVRRNPSASILTPIVGSIREGETRAVLEETIDSAKNIWVKIGDYQWFARIYQGNVKAIYL